MSLVRQALLGSALFAALGLFCWVQHVRLEASQAKVEHAREERDAARRETEHQTTQLSRLDQELTRQRDAQRTLGERLATTRNLLAQRQRTLEELTRENQALRAWAAQPLPDVARRLRQRPALVGADAYRQWVSSGEPLHTKPGESSH
ncbi:LysB family phage lysis regulatory protein [Pseudomonas mangiferae]|uniref:LysB family phage lysis regulatory protein n=1 Tax=Pseudomonas mangiferae TaxID=2593654 RepID=A0A553H0J6_9PSED|nr:LysB family phage lysis regulatory protein [Pseudomonas mangiferae]